MAFKEWMKENEINGCQIEEEILKYQSFLNNLFTRIRKNLDVVISYIGDITDSYFHGILSMRYNEGGSVYAYSMFSRVIFYSNQAQSYLDMCTPNIQKVNEAIKSIVENLSAKKNAVTRTSTISEAYKQQIYKIINKMLSKMQFLTPQIENIIRLQSELYSMLTRIVDMVNEHYILHKGRKLTQFLLEGLENDMRDILLLSRKLRAVCEFTANPL